MKIGRYFFLLSFFSCGPTGFTGKTSQKDTSLKDSPSQATSEGFLDPSQKVIANSEGFLDPSQKVIANSEGFLDPSQKVGASSEEFSKSSKIGDLFSSNGTSVSSLMNQSSSFSIGAPKIIPLSLGCEDELLTIKTSLTSNFNLQGKVCVKPMQIKQFLDFVVVMDISASMRFNDPLCKRYDALKALISKISQTSLPTDDIRGGLVLFNSLAEKVFSLKSNSNNNLSSLTAFINSNKVFICRNSLNTNYKDAFKKTEELFVEGVSQVPQKAVFLLSDGMPTEPRNNPILEGLNQVVLLKNIPGLNLYAVYLSEGNNLVPSSKSYLEQITGNPSFVSIVNKADDLSSALLSIKTNMIEILSKNDFSFKLSSQNKEIPINIESFQVSNENPYQYHFSVSSLSLPQGLSSFEVSFQKSQWESLQKVISIQVD